MSTSYTTGPARRLPTHQRLLARCAVAAARPLTLLRPRQLRAVLELARRGAHPATTNHASTAREAVVSVSLRCRTGTGCLQRSLAAALYCRATWAWPTWCSGVRTDPFLAHAWIEVDGQPIGEPFPRGHYRTLLRVPPVPRHRVGRDPTNPRTCRRP
jgi:hypothetical protein